ncbi:hypothetical protein ACJX0J_040662, partial [Zea mays]
KLLGYLDFYIYVRIIYIEIAQIKIIYTKLITFFIGDHLDIHFKNNSGRSHILYKYFKYSIEDGMLIYHVGLLFHIR